MEGLSCLIKRRAPSLEKKRSFDITICPSLKKLRFKRRQKMVLPSRRSIHCQIFRRQTQATFHPQWNDHLIIKGSEAAVKEWQFRQIVDALRLLFRHALRPPNRGHLWFECHEAYPSSLLLIKAPSPRPLPAAARRRRGGERSAASGGSGGRPSKRRGCCRWPVARRRASR